MVGDLWVTGDLELMDRNDEWFVSMECEILLKCSDLIIIVQREVVDKELSGGGFREDVKKVEISG